MNFGNFISSETGFIHFIASMLALILGTCILVLEKGTKTHEFIGKIYGISMMVTLVSAFMTYRLFGKWGIFHYTAVISSLTLLAGLGAIYLKRPKNNYLSVHFSFMYWSVMGVYGAFISETLVRMPKVVVESGIPNGVFYNMTGVGTAIVMGFGVYYFLKYKPIWDKKFNGLN